VTISTYRPSTPAAAAAEAARFAERQRQRRRLRWKLTGYGVLAALVALVAVWVVCFSGLLAVRSVRVSGVHKLDAAAVEQAARVPRGGSLALLDTAAIEARVRTLAPVADVSVERKFPHTVRIRVTERTPVAVLQTPQGRELVDAEGIAYAPAGDKAPYVVISTDQDSMTPESLLHVNQMIAALPESVRGKVKSVEADTDQNMSVELRDGRTIVWGGTDQPEFKAKVLDILLHDKSTRSARTFDVSVPEAPTVRR
jgi:cell division protein FtsQ